MSTFKVIAVSVAALVAALASHPAAAQKSKDTLRYPIPQAEPNFDRYTSPGSYHYVWSTSVFDDLLGFDPKSGKFSPALAKSWSQPDAVTYEYELRDDIKWHDGQKLTADDVVYTLNWLTDEKTTLRYKPNWAWIKSVEKLGPTKIRVTAKHPVPDGIMWMASGWPVYPKHVHEPLPNKVDFGDKPIGTGPYKINKIDKSGIVAEKYKDYKPTALKPNVSIGHIIAEPIQDSGTLVAALLTGKADLTANVPTDQAADLVKSGKFEVTLAPPALGYTFLTFPATGWKTAKQFADPRVRLAMAKAIDRKALLKLKYGDLVGKTQVIDGLCSKAQLGCGFTKMVPDYDPAGAKKLLAEAGYPDGFDVVIAVFQKNTAEATAVSGMLRAVGVRASVAPHTITQRVPLINQGKVEMGYHAWSGGAMFDVSPQIVRHFVSNDYDDNELNKAAIAAMPIAEDAARRAAIAKVFDEVHDKAYAFPMLPNRDTYTHTKEVKLVSADEFHAAEIVPVHEFAWK